MMHYGVSLVTWNLSNKCSVCWCAFIRATRHDEEYPTMCRLNSCSFAGFCVVSSGFCAVLSGFCVVLRSLFFITARQCNASETLRPNYISSIHIKSCGIWRLGIVGPCLKRLDNPKWNGNKLSQDRVAIAWGIRSLLSPMPNSTCWQRKSLISNIWKIGRRQ